MNNFQARQGDVFIETHRRESIPSGAKPVEIKTRLILAEGEITGHHHAITVDPTVCQAYELDGKIYLHIESPVELTHEEHGSICLPKGDFLTYIQHEYDPLAIRKVAD